MSKWRPYGTPCPITAEAVSWAGICGDCPYFRGMSSLGKDRKVNCNWPRNGAEIDSRPDLSVFDKEFWNAALEGS